MALAWKAGWVHALTSSNLVSSATSHIARTPGVHTGGSVFPGEVPSPPRLIGPPALTVRRPSHKPPAHPTQTPALWSSAGLPAQTPALWSSASATAQAFDHKTSVAHTPPRSAGLPTNHQPTRRKRQPYGHPLAFPHKRQPYGHPPALQRKHSTTRQAFSLWAGVRHHSRPSDHPGRSATAKAAGTMAATMSSSQAGIGPAPAPRKGRTRP